MLAFPGWSQTSIQLISDGDAATVIRFQIGDYSAIPVQTPDGSAYVIEIQDGTPLLKAGAPDLPKLTTSILIGDMDDTDISVISSHYTDIPDMDIAPSKGNLYRNVDPATVPYEYGAAYQTDGFYPQDLAVLRNPFIFRDFRGQTVVVHPVQYNPVSNVLRVYDDIVVRVKKVERAKNFSPERGSAGRAVTVNEPFDALYSRRFLNYASQADRYAQIPELGNLLIIAHGPFIPIIEPLVEWKRQKGIPTTVVDVATVGNNPSAIHAFLGDYFHNEGLTYVLLVGDENTVATMQTPGFNACDHCYSYQDGNDHFSEFFVGRFNAENEAQLQTMVDRTLEYEKTPYMDNPEWFRTGIGSGSSQGPGDDGEMDYGHINVIKSDLLNFTYGAVWEFYDADQSASSPTPGDVTADGAGNPQNWEIGDVINQGSSIYNYCGHGSHESLSTANFNVTTVHNYLNNTGMYPFLIAVACCVGDFQNDFGEGECLGDAWIRATDDLTGQPAGGIGGLFSTILQSWSPPMEGQDEMNKLIVGTGDYGIRHSLGGIAIHGFGSMIEDYGAAGEEMADAWCMFGDPSVVLWTDTPAGMTVSHAAQVNVGTSQLQVLCDVEDALVGLYYQGDVLGSGLVSGGVATINFEPVIQPEQILVTVTAFNRMPYQGPVDVVVTQGPYIVLDAWDLDDSAGNNNQAADFGEDILMNVTLENVGPVLASNVAASLISLCPDITITQNFAFIGDINENSLVNQNGAFAFSVAEFIQDQTVALFELTLNSDSAVWIYTLPVVINAPVLHVQSDFTLSDDLAGDGNGRMDQGETVQLTIPVKNAGHAASPDAIGTLTTFSPHITILNPEVDMGQIAQSGGVGEAVFDLQIAAEVPIATPVEFEFSVAAGPYGDQETFSGAINIVVEDFENGLTEEFNWDQLTTSEWFLTDLSPYEGDTCLQSGLITDAGKTQLSMTVNVLEAGMIAFARRVSSEEGWDFLRFFINGFQVDEWSGELPWAEVSEYVIQGGMTEFMWSYEKDEVYSNGADAAWIDNIILPLLVIPEDTVSGNRDPALSAEQFSVFPNPAKTAVHAKFTLDRPSTVSLVLYDAHGRLVQSIFQGDLPEGTFVKGFSIDTLPAGAYLAVLKADGGVKIQTIIKTRL